MKTRIMGMALLGTGIVSAYFLYIIIKLILDNGAIGNLSGILVGGILLYFCGSILFFVALIGIIQGILMIGSEF